MSYQYDIYLAQHKANVKKGFDWIHDNLPTIIANSIEYGGVIDYEWQIGLNHDASKTDDDEYNAYDDYFYGNNRSFAVVQAFNKAWLFHIHRNPHHWQYWVLLRDEPDEPTECIEMPHNYVIEMICDWWAFSWKDDDRFEIFDWYKEHKNHIMLHKNTRKLVEHILDEIEDTLKIQSI